MMDKEERDYREVEKRERLIQTFLIISGFLVAFVEEDFRRKFVLVFSLFLVITLIYYINLTRINDNRAIDSFAILTSISFSILILAFINFQLTDGFDDWASLLLLIVFTGIFTFSLLSPDRSEKIIKRFDKFSKNQEEKNPKLQAILQGIIFIIFIIIIVLVMCIYLSI